MATTEVPLQSLSYRDALNRVARDVIAGATKADRPEGTPSTAFDAWAVAFHAVSHMSTANLEATLGLLEARDLLDWIVFFLLAVSIAAELKAEGTEVELMDVGMLLLTPTMLLKHDQDEAKKRLSVAYDITRALIDKASRDPENNDLLRDLVDGLWKGMRTYIYTGKESVLDQMAPLYFVFFRSVFVRLCEGIGKAQAKPNE